MHKSTDHRRPRLAVVGAGVSGLVTAYRLRETHEVTVFEAGESDGRHYYAMEILPGVTLREAAAEPITDYRAIASSFAEMLDAQRGIGFNRTKSGKIIPTTPSWLGMYLLDDPED